MTYAEQIDQAHSPQEGMRILAAGIDELLAALKDRPSGSSGWGPAWTADLPVTQTDGPSVSDEDEIVVDLPAVDGPRMQARYDWAVGAKLGDQIDPPLSDEQAADAYARGGPLWLYLYDRDAVMRMPVEWRRMFVEDVEQDSPAQAQEMGRDLLKDAEPGTPERYLGPVTP